MNSNKQILEWWQENHGPLGQESKDKFLTKLDAGPFAKLRSLPEDVVKQALVSESRLELVVKAAAKIERDRHKAKRDRRDLFRRNGPTGKPPFTESLSHLAPSGVLGTTAPHPTGLVHRPSAPEVSTGDRCEHCGVHIPIGAAHEKCKS